MSAEETSDGSAALTLVSRRLQELRNQLDRIQRLEGKPLDYLNERQEALVRSKPIISAGINELEKLRWDLASAAGQQASSPDSNSDQSEESTKITSDVLGTENSGPSQVDQQNDGISLPPRMELVVNWRIPYYKYLLENRRLQKELEDVHQDFTELTRSGLAILRRAMLCNKIDSHPDQNVENSLSDQQNEGIYLSLREAKVKETFNATRNKQTVEVDWERCCQELKEKNLGLQRDVKFLKNEFIVYKTLTEKHPGLLDFSPDPIFLGCL